MADAKIRLKQVRSVIGYRYDQLATLRGLRLGKIGARAELEDTPSVRGMIAKVQHLVQVQEG